MKVNKDLAEKNKRSYEKMREKHKELKTKCGELFDQIKRMKNPYFRDPKDSTIDRLKKFNDVVRNRLRKMI